MLSVVVDDHDMNISHIIRGDDHLTNAARQSQIYEALGWDIPVFAHIPLIHGPDGAKLSKRHGALGVEAYQEMGYLPDAMRNYLARLGWSHGDDEIISTEQLTQWFDLDGINKGAARFDFAKLENLNGHYIRARADETLVGELLSFINRFDNDLYEAIIDIKTTKKQLLMAMPGLKERAKTLKELGVSAGFLFVKRPLALDEQADKMLDNGARALLGDVLPVLEELNDWRAETLEITIKEFVSKQGLKLGNLAQPLRAALTGTAKSPGIFDVIAVLGQDETLSRIRDQAQPQT
jgi:glutamyl-tRNA synthetase